MRNLFYALEEVGVVVGGIGMCFSDMPGGTCRAPDRFRFPSCPRGRGRHFQKHVPRTRGDEPKEYSQIEILIMFPVRAGMNPLVWIMCRHFVMFPVRAGMNPYRGQGGKLRSCSPRVRG